MVVLVSLRALMEQVLQKKRFVVCGDCTRDEEALALYQELKKAGYTVYMVHPVRVEVEGEPVYPHLDNLPDSVDCAVIVTDKDAAEELVRQAGHLKIPFVWLQPGADTMAALHIARYFGVQAIVGNDLRSLLALRQQMRLAS